jgi:hypothetical protein
MGKGRKGLDLRDQEGDTDWGCLWGYTLTDQKDGKEIKSGCLMSWFDFRLCVAC